MNINLSGLHVDGLSSLLLNSDKELFRRPVNYLVLEREGKRSTQVGMLFDNVNPFDWQCEHCWVRNNHWWECRLPCEIENQDYLN